MLSLFFIDITDVYAQKILIYIVRHLKTFSFSRTYASVIYMQINLGIYLVLWEYFHTFIYFKIDDVTKDLDGAPLPSNNDVDGQPLTEDVDGLPFDGVPIDGAPLDGEPLDGIPLDGVPLDGVPLDGSPGEVDGTAMKDESPGMCSFIDLLNRLFLIFLILILIFT